MLTVQAPDGSEIRCGVFGRGRIGLDGEEISRSQFELSLRPFEPTLLNLTNLGKNALVVVRNLPDGSEAVIDLLETDECAVLRGGERFYVASRKDAVLTVLRKIVAAPTDTVSILEEAGQEPAAKRPRISSGNPASSVPSTSGRDMAGDAAGHMASPFQLLRVQGIPEAANRAPTGIKLADVVSGSMEWALVSNFEIDLGWLLSACPDLKLAKKILLVHGESHPAILDLLKRDAAASGLGEKLRMHAPPLPIPYGTHHSKAFVIQYKEGVRIIVHTANLIYADANSKTQGLWLQDFPLKGQGSPTTSTFEADLLDYVSALRLPLEEAEFAKSLCRRHDFSSARACLIVSRPGYHQGPAAKRFGHMGLRAALEGERFPDSFNGSPVYAQFSSMGSLDSKWLYDEFQSSLCAGKTSANRPLGKGPASREGLQLIWPTVEEVQNSVEGWAAGRSIPGPAKNVEKPFLRPLYHRFSGAPAGRQRAMPHMKSFGRYQKLESGSRLAWVLLTSHNLSKAAWGTLQKGGTQLMIRSYELGVLLLPSLEASYRAHANCGFCCTAQQPVSLPKGGPGPAVEFWARQSISEQSPSDCPEKCVLPLPYKLPPEPYSPSDKPWMVDVAFEGLDSWGRRSTDDFPPLYGNVQSD